MGGAAGTPEEEIQIPRRFAARDDKEMSGGDEVLARDRRALGEIILD
jgi:hypothetical protein